MVRSPTTVSVRGTGAAGGGRRSRRIARLIGINVLLLGLALLAFELVAFFFAPASLVARLWPYRCFTCQPPPRMAVADEPLHGYFAAHPERGFTIARNVPPMHHYVDGVYYQVFSNSLGCPDRPPPANLGRYVYLGGDSHAWGYAPFEAKFGTLLEQDLGAPVLKCGVVHTGQAHQLSQMRDVIAEVGSRPAVIVVTFDPNDISNDFAHPHATVIDGWMVDVRSVRADASGAFAVHERDRNEVRAALGRALAERERAPEVDPLTFTARKYSVIANILTSLKNRLGNAHAPERETIYMPAYGQIEYLDSPYTERNRDAILGIRDFAQSINAQFLFVLMPSRYDYADPEYYAEIRTFLTTNGIAHLDLNTDFAGHALYEVFWPKDWHLNPRGNAIAAERIGARLKAMLAP
jgi:hypothetical protein